MQPQKVVRPGLGHLGVGGDVKGDIFDIGEVPLQDAWLADLTRPHHDHHGKRGSQLPQFL